MILLRKIKKSPAFQKGMIFLDQALVSGSNFLLGILLVRSIGLEAYGVFTLLWMVVFFAIGINQAFIIKPLLSIAPKLEDLEQEEYLSDLHSIQFSISSLFLLAGLVIYGVMQIFQPNEIFMLLPLVSMIVFCQTVHDFYRKTYLIRNQVFKICLIDLVLFGGQLIGVAILWFLGVISLESVLWIILGVNVLSVLFGKFKQEFSHHHTKKILIRHFHFSKWLLSTSILQWLSGNYFIIVGASILGTSAVGAIRMVQNLMGLCHILFLVMESLIPIEAARRFQAEGEDGLIQYLVKTTKQLGSGFILLLIVIALFSAPILSFIYGPEAVQYAYIAVAYSVLYAIVFIGHPLRFYLRTLEKTSPIFIAYCFGSFFSLSFAYPLLQFFSIPGLLFGLIFTQIINLLVYYFFSIRSSKNFIKNQLKESL